MANERRRNPRVKVNLPARWEGVSTRQEANVTDLSNKGCFVLTGGKVEQKELIRLEIKLPDEDPLYFWAEVVDAAFEIGFAVKFTSMDKPDQTRLRQFIEQCLVNE